MYTLDQSGYTDREHCSNRAWLEAVLWLSKPQ